MVKPTSLPAAAAPLPVSAPDAAPKTTTIQRTHNTPLWLCIHYPKLALEIHTNNNTQPAALITQTKGQYLINTASVSAEYYGIMPKMTLSAARALYPALQAYHADAAKQQHTLEQLAHWAQHFTSKVSIEAPHSLLLEIRGSLKLFGGIDALQQKIQQELQQRWHYTASTAIAPTTLASLLLATSGHPCTVKQTTALRSALGDIALYALPINKKRKQQLSNIGVRTLRDLWRLPKANLARRFGPELVNYLECLLGKRPDPRNSFHSPESFMASNELPMEVRSTSLILIAAQQLTEKLCRFLRNRDACITQCCFELYHGKKLVSTINIGLRIASRDAKQILTLLEEHLNKIKLTTSVTQLKLSTKQLQRFDTSTAQLLFAPENTATVPDHQIETLLEQLQARLGQQAIRHLESLPDHRPEQAHRFAKTPTHNNITLTQQRPLWLLPTPEPLTQKNNHPWHQGPIVLLTGPERIECGWWSNNSIRRDYYLASDTQGRKLWIYRDLQSTAQWYLHGLFG